MKALPLLILLAGCAASLQGANERGGIIGNHGWSNSKSFAMAQAHCQKYGRKAVINDTSTLEATMTFECVE